MTDQEKKAAFEGALPLLVRNPTAREQILNQYADAPQSSPMAAKTLEFASTAAPFIAMEVGGKRMAGARLAAWANLAGMIAAAITKRRTAEEQAKADTGILRNLAKLIPGVGAYDAMKRIGRQAQENVDRINERRAKRQAEKKADAQGMAKQAFSWADVMSKIREAETWFKSQKPEHRALMGAGAGLAGGALLGKLTGMKPSVGAAIGAAAGAGTGAYWNDVRKAIDAVRPVAGNAARKTKAYLAGLLPQDGQSEAERAIDRANAAAAEKKASVKTASFWDSVKAKIDDLAAGYSQLSQTQRMALNGAASALAGAGLGSMVAGKGNRGTGAILGALAGGAGGAVATKYIDSPKWFQERVLAGIKARMGADVKANDAMGRKYLQYLAEYAKSDEDKLRLLENADDLGVPRKHKVLSPLAALGEALGHPAADSDYHTVESTSHFDPEGLEIR